MNSDETTPVFPIRVTPKAIERANLLIQEKERQRDLYGQALIATATSPAPAHRAVAITESEAADVSTAVLHIAQAADQRMLDTHDRLQRAAHSASESAAMDPEVQRLRQALYGIPTPDASPERPAAHADVIDVQVVTPATSLSGNEDGKPQSAQ